MMRDSRERHCAPYTVSVKESERRGPVARGRWRVGKLWRERERVRGGVLGHSFVNHPCDHALFWSMSQLGTRRHSNREATLDAWAHSSVSVRRFD
eukprot:358462-Chlamydomonas_euryale.AAC.1